jgi:LAO/AO transport system kinase
VKQSIKSGHDLDAFSKGILSGDRIVLGQAITIIESNLESDQKFASLLLERVLPSTGNALRIGITGVPGVGKSTFIETFGKSLINKGKKPAVLTVDPSSPITKGSILGDKTRMDGLSKDPSAFVRPTPTSSAIGGVANKTREAMLLCEAAGYDVIIIETVGVGQSEVAVRNMVDFFLLLILAGAGDELQGIKKGIMEIADVVVITKADGANEKNALDAQGTYQQALHLFSVPASGWQPTVLTSSAVRGNGIEEVWTTIVKYTEHVKANGFFQKNRSAQNVSWFQDCFALLLKADLQKYKSLKSVQKNLEHAVSNLSITSQAAAEKLLDAYHDVLRSNKS